MIRRWNGLALTVALAVVAACGDGGPADKGGDTAQAADGDVSADGGGDAVEVSPFAIEGPVPPEELADALGRARCAFDSRCGGGFVGVPPATCVELASAHSWHATAIARMVPRGMTYDAEAMGDCLRHLAARPCDEVGATDVGLRPDDERSYFIRTDPPDWYVVAACRAALLGGQAAGEGCYYATECASGRCSATRDSCGACEAPLELGAACADFGDCGVDRLCDPRSERCVARVARGEPCRGDRECLPGLRCEGGDLAAETADGVCTGLGEVGRACDGSNYGAAWCPLGARCDGSECVAAPIRLAHEGEACEPSGGPTCLPDLVCEGEANGVCVRRSLGDACPHGNTDSCPLELVCGADNVCRVAADVGAPCTSTRDCAGGAFCERATARCKLQLGLGEACSAYPFGRECAYPYTCVGSRPGPNPVDGTCALGADPGEACGGKEDCGYGATCGSGACYVTDAYFGCR